jgi:hypothetical protein
LFLVSREQAVILFLTVATSFVLGLGIALLYRATHRGLSYEQSFLSTLVLLAPIVSLVMLFIQGDLVLSLGLVGSLSIIRFRTPIKDTRDMVFLFWIIAVGLGSGTRNWTLTAIATVLLGIIVSLLYLLEYGRPRHADYVLVVSGASPSPAKAPEEVIQRRTISFRVRSHEVEGSQWEKVYEIRFSRAQQAELDQLIKDVQDLRGVSKVSLLAPQLSL